MPDTKHLYCRGDIWHLRIEFRGQVYRRSLRTVVLKEAQAKRDKILAELEHEQVYREIRHSWKEAVVGWTEGFLPGVAPKTATRYLCSLGQFEHLLADLYIDEIDVKTVAKVAGRKGATNATRRRDLTALSSVLRSCVGWGWIESNPAKTYDRSIIPERRDPIHLPEDKDVDTLIASLEPGLARLVRFLDLTGCRLEEAADLKFNQLHLDRGECRVLGKRNRIRTIKLQSPGVPASTNPSQSPSQAVTVRHYSCAYVFWHPEGLEADRYHNPASNLSAAIGKLVRAKKINKFRIHDLRHRFAVRWLQAGGNIYALSRHLGHTSVKTTEIYLQFIPRPAEIEAVTKPSQVQRLFAENSESESS